MCAANEPCTVNCLGGENCCSHIKIDGTQASSLNITSSYRAMRWGVFRCPNGGNCDILCDEWDACKFINVTAFNSKNVTLAAGGGVAFSDSVFNATYAERLYVYASNSWDLANVAIYCPDNGQKWRNNRGFTCIIETSGGSAAYAVENTQAYAVDGFNDVSVSGNWNDEAVMHVANIINIHAIW